MYGLAIPLAVAAAAAWAVGMTAAKPALRYMDRLTYMLTRWGMVTLVALLYAWGSGTLEFSGGWPIVMAVVAGLIDGTAGGFFYLTAMERTSAYQTTTLSGTAPLWGVLASVVLLAEPLRWSVFAAAGLVVLGACFLVERSPVDVRSRSSGALFALLTGVLWGAAETVPSKLALEGGLSPATLLFVFAFSSVLGVALLLPFVRSRIPRRIERRGLPFVVLSAVGGAFLGWILWLRGLELAPASVLSPIRGATMVFAFAYSILFLRERPTRGAFLGLAMILGGVLLVSFAT